MNMRIFDSEYGKYELLQNKADDRYYAVLKSWSEKFENKNLIKDGENGVADLDVCYDVSPVIELHDELLVTNEIVSMPANKLKWVILKGIN